MFPFLPNSNPTFASFAGSYENNNQSNACIVSNEYSGDCACPQIGDNSLISCPSVFVNGEQVLILKIH